MRKKIFWYSLAIIIDIAIRFAFMFFTDHFDFRNFYMTGKLAAEGMNIYSSTRYYNYGFVFSLILGILYNLASLFSNTILAYKIFMVLLLTFVDFMIAVFVAKKADKFWGLIFFINPVSTYVVGYQTQFDNMAVMFGVWGVYYLQETSEYERFTMYDLYGTLLLSLSLITKHILWAFPVFILFNNRINKRKKILYAFVPPLLFLLSFIPYLPDGWNGIISNVFMYRSGRNFPLFALGLIHKFGIHLMILERYGLIIFAVLMLVCAYLFRDECICNSFLIYTMSLICCTSGMFGHQLVIPCAALIIIFRKWSLIYFVLYASRIFGADLRNTIIIWCLLYYLVYYYCHKQKT